MATLKRHYFPVFTHLKVFITLNGLFVTIVLKLFLYMIYSEYKRYISEVRRMINKFTTYLVQQDIIEYNESLLCKIGMKKIMKKINKFITLVCLISL